MLELTMGGRTISGVDAVAFFESLPDMLADDVRTDEFCDKYEYALNRLRYLVRQSIPIKPRVEKGQFTTYSCGHCLVGVHYGEHKFCPRCGRAIDWSIWLTPSPPCTGPCGREGNQ